MTDQVTSDLRTDAPAPRRVARFRSGLAWELDLEVARWHPDHASVDAPSRWILDVRADRADRTVLATLFDRMTLLDVGVDHLRLRDAVIEGMEVQPSPRDLEGRTLPVCLILSGRLTTDHAYADKAPAAAPPTAARGGARRPLAERLTRWGPVLETLHDGRGAQLTRASILDLSIDLREAAEALATARTPAAGPEGWRDAREIVLGKGHAMVAAGKSFGRPCVFLQPCDPPGEVGALAPEGPIDRGDLEPGSVVLIVLTAARAAELADQIVGGRARSIGELKAEGDRRAAVEEAAGPLGLCVCSQCGVPTIDGPGNAFLAPCGRRTLEPPMTCLSATKPLGRSPMLDGDSCTPAELAAWTAAATLRPNPTTEDPTMNDPEGEHVRLKVEFRARSGVTALLDALAGLWIKGEAFVPASRRLTGRANAESAAWLKAWAEAATPVEILIDGESVGSFVPRWITVAETDFGPGYIVGGFYDRVDVPVMQPAPFAGLADRMGKAAEDLTQQLSAGLAATSRRLRSDEKEIDFRGRGSPWRRREAAETSAEGEASRMGITLPPSAAPRAGPPLPPDPFLRTAANALQRRREALEAEFVGRLIAASDRARYMLSVAEGDVPGRTIEEEADLLARTARALAAAMLRETPDA